MDGWKLIELVQSLRQVSFSISSEDFMNAQYCLKHFPDLPEKYVIKSIFVHRTQDIPLFDMVWTYLIEQTPNCDKRETSDVPDEIDNCVSEKNFGFGGLGVGRGFGGISLSNNEFIDDVDEFVTKIPLSKFEAIASTGTDFEESLKSILADINYYSWINSFDLAYQRGALSEESWYMHQNQRINLLNAIQQNLLNTQIKLLNSWEPVVKQHWLFKPLNKLSSEEKELVKSSIKKWAKKLSRKPGLRWKANPKGSIDISRIIKQSAQCNGILFHLDYRKKILRSSELIVLCDISNSMASYVEFLIYLTICLRTRFKKIRVFLFIDAIWEVSNILKDFDYNETKHDIESWGHKVSSGYSDYGKVFKELVQNNLCEFSSQATIIILGDGKNNYRPAQTEYLAQIFNNVRSIIWLNPLNTEEWQEPDNMMKEYQKYCSKVFRCCSANDLSKVLRDSIS